MKTPPMPLYALETFAQILLPLGEIPDDDGPCTGCEIDIAHAGVEPGPGQSERAAAMWREYRETVPRQGWGRLWVAEFIPGDFSDFFRDQARRAGHRVNGDNIAEARVGANLWTGHCPRCAARLYRDTAEYRSLAAEALNTETEGEQSHG